MTDDSQVDETTHGAVPATRDDADSPAMIDAEKTLKITLISALLFCLSAAFIILRTRMG